MNKMWMPTGCEDLEECIRMIPAPNLRILTGKKWKANASWLEKVNFKFGYVTFGMQLRQSRYTI